MPELTEAYTNLEAAIQSGPEGELLEEAQRLKPKLERTLQSKIQVGERGHPTLGSSGEITGLMRHIVFNGVFRSS